MLFLATCRAVASGQIKHPGEVCSMKGCCQATTFAYLMQLLLICVSATSAATPAATPEIGDATRDLVAGKVPAALEILKNEGAPEAAPATGELSCKGRRLFYSRLVLRMWALG